MMLQGYSDIVDGANYETLCVSATHGTLTKAQGITLLSKLVDDSAFKMRFEQAPAQALAEIGIPAEQIATLRVACVIPRMLASVDTLKATLRRLTDDIDTSVLNMIVPGVKFGG
jgi:putative modified peptide